MYKNKAFNGRVISGNKHSREFIKLAIKKKLVYETKKNMG